MLQATRTFIACDGTRFFAGRSRIAETEKVAHVHAENFEPVPDSRGGAREAIRVHGPVQVAEPREALPVAPLGFESWRLLSSAPECSITTTRLSRTDRISSSAQADLLAEVERTTAIDGLEVGGLIFGSAGRDLLEAVAISGPGPNAQRERTSFRFDPAYNADRTAEMKAAGLTDVGEWHSHPSSAGVPSTADLTAFSRRRARLGIERYIALLAVETRDGWRLVPWIVSGSFGRAVCEPARL